MSWRVVWCCLASLTFCRAFHIKHSVDKSTAVGLIRSFIDPYSPENPLFKGPLSANQTLPWEQRQSQPANPVAASATGLTNGTTTVQAAMATSAALATKMAGSPEGNTNCTGRLLQLEQQLVSMAAANSVQFPNTTDVLIRSYHKDAQWFEFAVRSFQKYGTPFRMLHVVVPDSDAAMFQNILQQVGVLNAVVHSKLPILSRGYDEQQLDKLNADTYSDAPYICIIDSDSIFTHPVQVSDFFKDGKPLHVWRTRAACGEPCDRWAVPIQRMFAGLENENEYMTRLGQVYPREAFQLVREELRRVHNCSLEQYCVRMDNATAANSTENESISGYFISEFNALGATLYRQRPALISWCQSGQDCVKQWFPPVLQGWSWGNSSDTSAKQAVFECILNYGLQSERCRVLMEQHPQVYKQLAG